MRQADSHESFEFPNHATKMRIFKRFSRFERHDENKFLVLMAHWSVILSIPYNLFLISSRSIKNITNLR